MSTYANVQVDSEGKNNSEKLDSYYSLRRDASSFLYCYILKLAKYHIYIVTRDFIFLFTMLLALCNIQWCTPIKGICPSPWCCLSFNPFKLSIPLASKYIFWIIPVAVSSFVLSYQYAMLLLNTFRKALLFLISFNVSVKFPYVLSFFLSWLHFTLL